MTVQDPELSAETPYSEHFMAPAAGDPTAVLAELKAIRRQTEAAWHMPNGFVSAMSAGMHTALVGFNPAYTVTAMSQIMTLLHPELTKKYGAAKSALTIICSGKTKPGR